MITYAYLRVSTEEQDHGNDAQRATISRTTHVDEWFEERASGKDLAGRPVFRDLLDRVCEDQALLVVAKLDRLGRSVIDVLSTFERLHQCGASIKVIDMGIDTTTPAGKMMLTVLAAFGEFERDMISQRTKEGLAAAAAKGIRLGRPDKYDRKAIANWLFLGTSVKNTAKHFGCSVRTVQRIAEQIA